MIGGWPIGWTFHRLAMGCANEANDDSSGINSVRRSPRVTPQEYSWLIAIAICVGANFISNFGLSASL